MKYNLLLPIAGKAQRFINAGYKMPKPLIMARNKQIIDLALDSFDLSECNLIFAVREDHINNFAIDKILEKKFGDVKIVVVDHDTDGSVSTCLLAKDYINNNDPLIIYTPDVCFEPQFKPQNIKEELDGLILTFKANSPAHSYVEVENGCVIKTAEKKVISSNAAVGVYYFKRGSDFVRYAQEQRALGERVNNEFYICPLYNMLIRDKLKIGIQEVEKMHVLGTPKELEFYVDNVAPKFGEKPVGLCCDHSGYNRKEDAKTILNILGIDYIDFGCHLCKDIDYNEYVNQATQAIQNKVCDFVLGFCRTGQGVNILANKKDDIRAALIFNPYTAEMARRHNSANFFSIPEKYTNFQDLQNIITTLINSSFDGGRHLSRIYDYQQ